MTDYEIERIKVLFNKLHDEIESDKKETNRLAIEETKRIKDESSCTKNITIDKLSYR
jgi:hypothetical protein